MPELKDLLVLFAPVMMFPQTNSAPDLARPYWHRGCSCLPLQYSRVNEDDTGALAQALESRNLESCNLGLHLLGVAHLAAQLVVNLLHTGEQDEKRTFNIFNVKGPS